jgi:hypothetical protein
MGVLSSPYTESELVMAVRPGTGMVVKFFKRSGESVTDVMSEVNALTDKDLAQLVQGISDDTLNY